MCATCGCEGKGPVSAGEQRHPHDLGAAIGTAERLVKIKEDLLAKNDRLAAQNRTWLARRKVPALNLLSGPGAGKTTLLERTIAALAPLAVSVLECLAVTVDDDPASELFRMHGRFLYFYPDEVEAA